MEGEGEGGRDEGRADLRHRGESVGCEARKAKGDRGKLKAASEKEKDSEREGGRHLPRCRTP